jgi:hypothetical protein
MRVADLAAPRLREVSGIGRVGCHYTLYGQTLTMVSRVQIPLTGPAASRYGSSKVRLWSMIQWRMNAAAPNFKAYEFDGRGDE